MGVLIAILVIALWAFHLAYLLVFADPGFKPVMVIHIAIQTYLFTGLFITAHDAMHGLVSSNRKVNTIIGNTATWLFAALSYSRLNQKHQLHHRFPGQNEDPDYCSGSQNFCRWWFSFLKNYVTWGQIITLAIVFNILQIWIDQFSLVLFWIIPSILATFQLFYFGTFRPHRLPHTEAMKPHQARSQNGPHWWAMLSCYFFGYHYEHHESPQTPWWKLYQIKNRNR